MKLQRADRGHKNDHARHQSGYREIVTTILGT